MEDPKSVIQAFQEGAASAYLVKPISLEAIKKEIGKLKIT
jgi:hypothetical protein